MKTMKKGLLLALCAVLLVVSTVLATMAFLTDKDSVKNTFTFGQVGISLDEAKVKTNGVVESGADRTSTEGRVQTNEYHLLPGHEYTKDPTIHVDSNSEDCWLFVKLNNGLKDIIAEKTIETQMTEKGWNCIDEDNNIWAYQTTVSAGAHIEVFDNFKLIDDADVSKYATTKDDQGNVTGGATIDVTAYAVQKDSFDTAQAAWNATSANFLANS